MECSPRIRHYVWWCAIYFGWWSSKLNWKHREPIYREAFYKCKLSIEKWCSQFQTVPNTKEAETPTSIAVSSFTITFFLLRPRRYLVAFSLLQLVWKVAVGITSEPLKRNLLTHNINEFCFIKVWLLIFTVLKCSWCLKTFLCNYLVTAIGRPGMIICYCLLNRRCIFILNFFLSFFFFFSSLQFRGENQNWFDL